MKKILLFILLLILTSCGDSGSSSSDDPPPSKLQTIIKENVFVIDDLAELSLSDINGTTYTYDTTLSESPFQADDIIVSAQGDGYLRKVVSSDLVINTLTVETADALLTEAIQQCEVTNTIQLESEDFTKSKSKAVDHSGTVIYDGPAGGADIYIEMTNGNIDFDPSVKIDHKIQNSSLKEFSAVATGDLYLNCDFLITTDGSVNFTEEITLASYSHTFVQFIGVFPVVEVLTIEFRAGFEANIDAACTMESGFTTNNSISVGAKFKNGDWSKVWNPSLSANGHPIQWGKEGDASFKCYIKPQVSVKFYNIAGPGISIEPYLLLNASLAPLEMWKLYAGLQGNLNFEIDLFFLESNYSTTLFDWNTVIDEWTEPVDIEWNLNETIIYYPTGSPNNYYGTDVYVVPGIEVMSQFQRDSTSFYIDNLPDFPGSSYPNLIVSQGTDNYWANNEGKGNIYVELSSLPTTDNSPITITFTGIVESMPPGSNLSVYITVNGNLMVDK